MKPVYFVGAGPGDPELISVKGSKILKISDVVLYAGSLVPETLLEYCKPETETMSSAGLNLNEQVDYMFKAVKSGKLVVRLHTGDPGLYGAIGEQIQLLKECGIDSVVIPGITASFAAAAAAGKELTLPDISQTVIITRLPGRTNTPETERISELARHRATMCLYLSSGMAQKAQDELSAGYPADTPVMIGYMIGWPDQRIIYTRLDKLAQTMKKEGINRQAVIMVGDVFGQEKIEKFSKLYDPDFEHGYRSKTED